MTVVSTWIRQVQLFLYSDRIRIHSTALFSSFLAQHYCTSLLNFLDSATICWWFPALKTLLQCIVFYCFLVSATFMYLVTRSVADPGCLSRILIFIHSGSRIRIQQRKRGKKIVPFYVATNFTKLKIILVLKC